jgi:hypothetical protein
MKLNLFKTVVNYVMNQYIKRRTNGNRKDFGKRGKAVHVSINPQAFSLNSTKLHNFGMAKIPAPVVFACQQKQLT